MKFHCGKFTATAITLLKKYTFFINIAIKVYTLVIFARFTSNNYQASNVFDIQQQMLAFPNKFLSKMSLNDESISQRNYLQSLTNKQTNKKRKIKTSSKFRGCLDVEKKKKKKHLLKYLKIKCKFFVVIPFEIYFVQLIEEICFKKFDNKGFSRSKLKKKKKKKQQ